MSVTIKAAKLLLQTIMTVGSASGLLYTAYAPQVKPAVPVQVVNVQPERNLEFEKAFFQAAKVYGRAGCGDQQLAEMTAQTAIDSDLPPAVVAAVVASESTCNPMAVSNRGALGLMQVVPKVHGKHYDFTKVNLLNPKENMRVGSDILSAYVHQYGLKSGLRHYYGTGIDNLGLGGDGYAERVLVLAGKV